MDEQLRQSICDWIADCDQFEYPEDEDEARSGAIDKYLTRWIERHYYGGMSAFIADGE